MSAKQKIVQVVDLPTQILKSLFAPLMFAGFDDHSPLLTMIESIMCSLVKPMLLVTLSLEELRGTHTVQARTTIPAYFQSHMEAIAYIIHQIYFSTRGI